MRLAAILYQKLGIGTTMILALSGVYGTIAFTSNVVTTLFLTDAWGRRKYVSQVFLTLAARHNRAGSSPAMAGIIPLTLENNCNLIV